MSVTSLKEINAGRTGNADDKFRREYRRTFRALTNNSLDGPNTVIAASPIKRFDSYVDPNGLYDPWALADKIEAAPEDEEFPYQWLLHVDYSTDIWDRLRRKGQQNSDSPQPQNPLIEPPDISFDFSDDVRVLDLDLGQGFDANGNAIAPGQIPVQNSAGERFSPPKEVGDATIVMTIVRNEPTYNARTAASYFNTVNSDSFFSFAPGTVMCKGIKGVSQFKNDYYYWKVSYVFWIKTRTMQVTNAFGQKITLNGWQIDEAPLDHGRRQLVAGKLVDIISAANVPVDDGMLNGVGVYQAPGSTPVYLLDSATQTKPRFRYYSRNAFANLGLGS